jgi:ABC-2 type transport system ATP-binding protein
VSLPTSAPGAPTTPSTPGAPTTPRAPRAPITPGAPSTPITPGAPTDPTDRTGQRDLAVDVHDLWVRFGSVEAVRGIHLRLTQGAATALLGRNGAGKSTTMRVLAGVIPPTEGRVLVGGFDIRTDTLAVKRLTGYCPDVGGLVPRATPWEHLQLSARLRRLPAGWEEPAKELLERFDLGGAEHRVTAGFSHGMGRRMSVILAAFHQPAVLLLDEPFDGVDPLGVEATLQVVADARSRGAAVLVSTHLRELAVEACDTAMVLRGGSAVAELGASAMAGEAGAGVYRSLLG